MEDPLSLVAPACLVLVCLAALVAAVGYVLSELNVRRHLEAVRGRESSEKSDQHGLVVALREMHHELMRTDASAGCPECGGSHPPSFGCLGPRAPVRPSNHFPVA